MVHPRLIGEGSVVTQEERHLILADRHIAETESRIERQRALLAGRRAAGAYTAAAEELLVGLEESLTLARQHRLLIVREIDRRARLQGA